MHSQKMITYYTLILGKCQMFDLRFKMALKANSIGIKPTARMFETSIPTVKKWMIRYNLRGKKGLLNQSRKPKSSPNQISEENSNYIETLRKKTNFGSERLRQEFELPHSNRTIHKVFKRLGLVKKKRQKKHHTKRDLREEKAKKYKPLRFYQMDVKYLTDIPKYYKYMVWYKLPRYQYTIREVRSGAMFLAFGDKYNMLNSCLFIEKFLNHLKNNNIPMNEVIIQTDNGSEFSGSERKERDRGFKYTVEKQYGAKHRFIPPGLCNANADVETVHSLIENEFFNLEEFKSPKEFYDKINTYQFYFNYYRKNSYKGWKSPTDLVKKWMPEFNYGNYFYFFPVDLNREFEKKFDKYDKRDIGVTMSVNFP